MDEHARFESERDAALLSLDEDRIRAMHRKWTGDELPTDAVLFWGSIHKAITGIATLPLAFRRESKRWLGGHGLRSLDDGEL